MAADTGPRPSEPAAPDELETPAVVIESSPRAPRGPGLHCYYRPDRTTARLFSAQDAARIICRVLEQTEATEAEILERRRKTCPAAGKESKPPDQAEQQVAEQALEQAMAAQGTSGDAILDAWDLLLVVAGILAAIAALGLVLPILRPVRVAAAAASVQVAATIRVLTSAKAANDAAFVVTRAALAVLRRAA